MRHTSGKTSNQSDHASSTMVANYPFVDWDAMGDKDKKADAKGIDSSSDSGDSPPKRIPAKMKVQTKTKKVIGGRPSKKAKEKEPVKEPAEPLKLAAKSPPTSKGGVPPAPKEAPPPIPKAPVTDAAATNLATEAIKRAAAAAPPADPPPPLPKLAAKSPAPHKKREVEKKTSSYTAPQTKAKPAITPRTAALAAEQKASKRLEAISNKANKAKAKANVQQQYNMASGSMQNPAMPGVASVQAQAHMDATQAWFEKNIEIPNNFENRKCVDVSFFSEN